MAAMHLAAIVENSDDAIVSKDLNGIVTSWNAAAELMFGYTAEEMVGQPILTLIPPELHKDEEVILGKIRRGERIHHFETVRVTKSGRLIDVSLTISPVKDANGRVIGAAKIVREITERKRADELLRQTEKWAATGRLAASIAHEINNPMQALTNLMSLISYKTSQDPKTQGLVTLADSELTRMAHITRQMLSLYRESAQPVPIKVTDVMEDVLDLYVGQLRTASINVVRRYDFSEQVLGFPAEMSQLFANLLGNAIEAIGAGGRILVRITGGREWRAPDRPGVRIVIADNGPGIDAQHRAQVFEPFFTTKAEKGTGLGLWVVKGIVNKHEGAIQMRSSTAAGHKGTVFSIFLPMEINRGIEAAVAASKESAA